MAAPLDHTATVPRIKQLANLDPITCGIEEDTFCFFCRSYERHDRAGELEAPDTGSMTIEHYVEHIDTRLWIAARAMLLRVAATAEKCK